MSSILEGVPLVDLKRICNIITQDFTEDAVFASLCVLTNCMMQGLATPIKCAPVNPPETNEGYTQANHLQTSPETNEGYIHSGTPLETSEENVECPGTPKGDYHPPRHHSTTPLESSEKGPHLSLSGRRHIIGSNTMHSRGGIRTGHRSGHRSEMEILNESALDSRQQLKETEDK